MARESFVKRAGKLAVLSDHSLRGKLPADILQQYEVHEWKHATAVLQQDFPQHLQEIIEVLRQFEVRHSQIVSGGGGKAEGTKYLEASFNSLGWSKKRWETAILLDSEKRESPTHEVDCVKGNVALEIEWSNKDPFYDRDLNNFRLLYDLRAISVGIIITKCDELASVFDQLGTWSKYGTTTTWMSKLLPRIEGNGAGGCPLLVFGIRACRYRANK